MAAFPHATPLAEKSRETKDLTQLTLTLAADGGVFLNNQPMLREALTTQLQAIYADRVDKTIFLEADRNLSYGQMVDVMDDCKAAGVATIGVITKRERAGAL